MFACLKRIILESVGHKLRLTPLDVVLDKNKFLYLKTGLQFPINGTQQLFMYFVPIKSY